MATYLFSSHDGYGLGHVRRNVLVAREILRHESELVRHQVTGLLGPVDDDAAFAAALAQLLSDPVLARRLGLAGRRLVGSEFTPSGATDRLLAVFAGSAGTPGR